MSTSQFNASSHRQQAVTHYNHVLQEVACARAEILRQRRLAVERLVSVRRRDVPSSERCAICRGGLRNGECSDAVRIGEHACDVLYGRECISMWLNEHASCPNCNRQL